MLSPKSSSLRSTSRILALGVSLGLSLAAPGCKKNKDSDAPGGSGAASKAEVDKKIADAKKEAKVAGLVDLANKDLGNGRYISAAKRADEALAENPDNADAYAVLGAAKWRAGQFVASTDAYRKALELDAKNFGASLGLARNLQAIGQHEEAIALQNALLADDKNQIDPQLAKLWSHYALCQADAVVKVTDELFTRMPAEDPLLPLVQSYAAFARAYEGKGALCTVEGTTGGSNLDVNLALGVKVAGAVVGSGFSQVVLLETLEESIIDPGTVKALKLKEVGKYKPPGAEEEVPLVLVPEVKFGKISLKNIPAIVQPLGDYEPALGETPAMVLGHQALQAFGTITFDFPNSTLDLAAASPTSAPDGAAEVPLVMLSMHVRLAPAIPMKINGSDHEFYVYLGGLYQSGVAITKKQYFKSGNLPRSVQPPDDADLGLKMVLVDQLQLGDAKMPGTGALVLVNEPADVTLGQWLENTGFELGGFVNLGLVKTWKVTFALKTGKAYIKG
jgi:tetratricopeptide (TPR) repeat protein